MVVLRRGGAAESVVVIEHALTTPLDLVAGQVWRGSLVLADYFLNNVQQVVFRRFCLVLSCPVLSCPVLSCPVLSYPVLSCLILSCPVLSYPVLSFPVCRRKEDSMILRGKKYVRKGMRQKEGTEKEYNGGNYNPLP